MTKPKTTKLVAGRMTYEMDPIAGSVTASCTEDTTLYGASGGIVELLLFALLEEAQLLRKQLLNTGIASERQQVALGKSK